MSGDTLSAVLRAIRLTGAVFFDVEARAPWVAEAPAAQLIAPRIMPGVEHVIEYHVVTSGSCWAGLVDECPVQLHAGDIVVFPQGDRHVVSSAPGMRGEPNLELHQRVPERQLPFVLNLGDQTQRDEQEERTHVICGFLGCDATPFNPLLTTLPRVLCVQGERLGGVLEHFIRFALAESQSRRPGGECVLARLSELLFIEVVRHYVTSQPAESTGWLAGLRDEQIGRALARLHEQPAHAWTLDELAKQVGISRSVLSERFTHFVGTPPMNYLAQWRMQLAVGLLSGGSATLAEIAERVGYGSEAAFSRAFKRLVGIAPALWRQGHRAAPDRSPTPPLSPEDDSGLE